MRIYEFEEIDDQLTLLPMAARRALDCIGRKMSLKTWQALPIESRRALVEAGCEAEVDVAQAETVLSTVTDLESVPVVADPPSSAPPDQVLSAFTESKPIPAATWSALSSLDRYTLMKVSRRRREPRLRLAYAEIVGHSASSTHLEPKGGVRMVDVGSKPVTRRTAQAESTVAMNEAAFKRLQAGDAPKGDVLGTARVAGIMAAKKTAELIPLCHPLKLTKVSIDLVSDAETHTVHVASRVEAIDQTGVEMEALVTASSAALTVYDMLKAFDKAMQIGPTRLLTKTGGRSGDYRA